MKKAMMKKHIWTLIFSLVLLAGLAVTAAAADYTDVPSDHWAAENIGKATDLGIFNGVSEGRFGLEQPISRAEFVTALVRFFDWDTVDAKKTSYADVSAEAWYASYVETARANSAVAASGKDFYPDEAVTRSEMASMLLRSLGYTYLAGTADEYSVPFSDVTVNKGFITLAYDLGLMTGTSARRFEPDAPATREQAATVLVRVHDCLETEAVRLDDPTGFRSISIAVPKAQEDTEMPITPLEPLTDLYATLRRTKYNDGELSQAALCLTAGGVQTCADEEGALVSKILPATAVKEILARENVKTYYSAQYESAYCLYEDEEGRTVTLWYQSDESLAAKLQLARLFGVTRYLLE